MTKQKLYGQAEIVAVWLIYALISVWLAIAVSWWVYARFDYGYGFWYDTLEIREHISRYAPAHRHKHGFEELSPAQHARMFHEIRVAVHEGGAGLEDIRYPAPDGNQVRVLDDEETQHLQDVAMLMDRAFTVSLVLVPVWLILAWRVARRPLPRVRARLVGAAVLMVSAVAPLVIFGPKTVFYQFHIWLFPSGNKWFFYWEESLMSTLMKAPFLFGGIAAVIGLGAVLLTPVLYLGGKAIFTRRETE